MSSSVSQVSKLSHKAFRALLKKFRRKKKRQLLARKREEQDCLEQQKREKSPNFQAREEEKQRNAKLWEEFEERERIRRHKVWLVREEQSQAVFRRKKLLQEQEKMRKEEERRIMLAELEDKNLLESVVEEKNKKEKNKKEEVLQEALSELAEGNRPWHNPIAPADYNTGITREQCQFFAKTGCCRFGERCSRGHIYPEVSCTLLIKGMYSHFSIEQSKCDDYDTDIALEFEERDTYHDFTSFYMDVLPEFRKCGNIVQFKVCSNHEPHLRGNVYVQFSREKHAVEAYKKFNGRYYAGKQLSCEFTNVIRWKAAICGLYESRRCPKGNNCNFLHVFKNPNNEFWAADRDLPGHHRSRNLNSYDSHSQHSHQSGYSSQRSRYDSWHNRKSNRSPDSSTRHSSSHSTTKRLQRSLESDTSEDECKYSSRTIENRKDDSAYKETTKKRKHSRRSQSASPTSSSSPFSEAESKRSRKKKRKHRKSKKKKKRSSS